MEGSENETVIWSREPDPIQSYDKFSNIARFNAQENQREQLHKNDPVGTKILHYSVVVVVVVIAFLIFFKLCWDTEKFSRRNPQLANEQLARRMSATKATQMTKYGPAQTTDAAYATSLLPELSNYNSRRHSSGGKAGLRICSKPACFCPGTGGGMDIPKGKQKGWKRDKDYEPYGPSSV